MPHQRRFILQKTVALVGMMGSGKSAVGNAVAHTLGVPFTDTDAEIERAADRSIAEIFECHGEAFFRDKETRVLARLLEGPPVILSTGGGAYMSETNRRLISQKGVAVWLRADLHLLWSRVRHKTTRPLLCVPNPRARLVELCTERQPHYAKAEIAVEARPDYCIQEMADVVISALRAYGGGIFGEAL